MNVAIIGYGKFGKALAELLSNNGYHCFLVTANQKKALDDGNLLHQKSNYIKYEMTFSARRTSVGLTDIIESQEIDSNIYIDLSTNPVDLVETLYTYFDSKQKVYVELPQLGSSISLAKGESTSLAVNEVIQRSELTDLVDLIGSSKVLLPNKLEPTKLKLIHNFLASGYLSLYRTIFQSADNISLPRSTLIDVLNVSPLHCKLLEAKSSMIIKQGYIEAQFSVENMIKDLDLYGEINSKDNLSDDLFKVVESIFKKTERDGKGKLDTSSVVS